MKQYVALDCSLKQISVCVMTEQRRIVTQAVIAADAGSIAEFVRSHAPEAEVIGLESGPTSPWLFHALRAEGFAGRGDRCAARQGGVVAADQQNRPE